MSDQNFLFGHVLMGLEELNVRAQVEVRILAWSGTGNEDDPCCQNHPCCAPHGGFLLSYSAGCCRYIFMAELHVAGRLRSRHGKLLLVHIVYYCS